MKPFLLHRILQLISLLLGVRFIRLVFLAFSLYVSAFFLIGEDSLKENKIHGIIFCSIFSIAAGGLINQFYDQEKDKIIKPFRSKWQDFLKQKYILYFYLIFNVLSLGVSLFFSWRIFFFFLIYQFFIWLYSHKFSKVLVMNNLTYVILSLYPFFGILVYFQHFSLNILLLSIFLFLLMLSIDIMKDLLTIDGDRILGYQTLPIVFGEGKTINIFKALLVLNILNSILILLIKTWNIHSYYFILSAIFFLGIILFFKQIKRNSYQYLFILLKIWVFVGVLLMLF